MNLTTLMAEGPPPAPEVRLRGGVKVRPRPLTLRETAAVREAIPRPLPPMVKDPAKGAAALKIPDENDPAYRRACADHYYAMLVAEAAIAIDFEVEGLGPFCAAHEPPQRAEWIRRASEDLSRVLTEPELAAVNEALARADRELAAAAREGLIVSLGDEVVMTPPDPTDPSAVLPENYGQTKLYALLRMCERFGIDPTRALIDMAPADRTMLLQYCKARQQEEDKRDSLFVKAAAMKV